MDTYMSATLPWTSWKVPIGLSELLALMDVRDHHVHGCLHDADGAGRQNGTLVVEPGHQHVDALADLAKHVLLGHFTVLENEFAGFRTAHAELVELLGHGKPGKSFSTRNAVMPFGPASGSVLA